MDMETLGYYLYMEEMERKKQTAAAPEQEDKEDTEVNVEKK